MVSIYCYLFAEVLQTAQVTGQVFRHRAECTRRRHLLSGMWWTQGQNYDMRSSLLRSLRENTLEYEKRFIEGVQIQTLPRSKF